MSQQKLNPLLAWLFFIVLAMTWGSSFILMKRGLRSFSYEQIGFIRIGCAFLFTLILAAPRIRKLKRQDIKALVAVGLFGNAIPYTLFPLGVTHLDSSLVGILNSTVPLFTLIIGLVFFKVGVRWMSVVGIILGLAGAVWLLLPDLSFNPERLEYGAYPILASICYAISINTVNSRLQGLDSLSITMLSLLFVGPPALGYVLLTTDFVSVMQTDPLAWLNLGYVALLGILGSSLAIIIFNTLIKKTSSLFAASVTYAIPIVALIWGVIDGENVGLTHIGGMVAILSGVYLVNLKGSPASRIRKRLRKKG